MKKTLLGGLFFLCVLGILLYAIFKPSYCELSENTEKIEYGFVYKARVKVKEGFFKNHTGEIISQQYGNYRFGNNNCYVPEYLVSLDDAGYLTTNQSNLELIK